MSLVETTIGNTTIQHDRQGNISTVTIDGMDIRNTISQKFNLINIRFDPWRPDNAKVTVPNEYEEIFQTIFSSVDELYRTGRGCLAAYLSSFLFESLTPYWAGLMKKGQHILAISFWRKILSITHEWENKTGQHVHKGSPYAFLANTYLIIGDVVTGFSFIYNAIEDDIELNRACPELNYPSEAPVYRTASLSSNPQNIMVSLVREIRSELEIYLNIYRKEFSSSLSMAEFDKRFLQNPALETIKYYFVFSFWIIFEYCRKVEHNLMQNDFSKLKHAGWLFALCLTLDKLFESHPKYKDQFLGSEIVNFAVDKGLMPRNDLNDLIKKENIQNGEPDKVTRKLLRTTLQHKGVPVAREIQYLLIAWNLRNFGGHNIQTQNVLVENFENLLRILLCDIFMIITEY